jgi:hypothetical protein
MALVLVAGCGRIGFDPRATASDGTLDTASDAAFTGLLHYWPLDEASGVTLARDVIGGADAALVAPADFGPGTKSNGLVSNAGGFAFVAMPSDMIGVAKLAIAAWFKRSAPNGKEQLGQELTFDMQPNNNELSIQFWNDGLIYFCVGQNANCATLPSNDTSWHHVVMNFDGTQAVNNQRIAAYVDGATVSLTYTGAIETTTGPAIGNHFDLGAVTDNEGQDTGTIDDVRVYDHPLTAAEVAALQ